MYNKLFLINFKGSKNFKSYDEFLISLIKAINPNNKKSVSYYTFSKGIQR